MVSLPSFTVLDLQLTLKNGSRFFHLHLMVNQDKRRFYQLDSVVEYIMDAKVLV